MSDTTSDSTNHVESETCFHCGLPSNNGPSIPQYKVLGKQRDFCCHGCLVVCQTIIDAGLDDYYQFRTTPSLQAEKTIVPELLKNLQIYDRPELQKSFVYQGDDWQEAALILEDIRCPACLWLNEHHLRQQQGVLEVTIDAATQRMRIRWNPQLTELSSLLKAIADIGYIAHPYDAKHTQALFEKRRTRSIERLIYAGLLGMMVMNFSLATYFLGGDLSASNQPIWITIGRWSSLFVSITLLVFPAQDFWLGAWRDFKAKRLGMDLPIVIGLSAALLGSLHTIIVGRGEVYFDSIAMFVFFVLLARFYEIGGKVKAAAYIDQLGKATPQTAFKLTFNKEWLEIPVFDLVVDDVVRVLPGETVPADGELYKGVSSFDESLLTGESLPVVKALGESVVSGAVNGEQAVQIKIKNIGQDTVLGSIKRMVDAGLEKKPDSVIMADKVARVFVPAILLLAMATALSWYLLGSQDWLANTIAVLIVTCPCALALATPVALSVSAGRLVKMGVLPLNMRAIEALANANVVAFDKTGTLTEGHPKLTDSKITDDRFNNITVLQIAASLAQVSEHPLAKALKQSNKEGLLKLSNSLNKPGFGLSASIDNQQFYLGNLNFIEQHIDLSSAQKNVILKQLDIGQSVTLLASLEGVLAIFSFADNLRQGSVELIQSLHKHAELQSVILSGDTQSSVDIAAKTLGIVEAKGGLSPQDKYDYLVASQKQGNTLLMFGDGINDAPTLAAADVSVSITGATDLAHVSSDFVLLSSDLSVLYDAKILAQRCRDNIKQNMTWAVTYNVLAVPLAILGFVPPWMAAIGMSASSLIVVLNALRLKS